MVTGGYIGLPGVTGVTRGEKELQGITSSYRRYEQVTVG